MFEYAFVYSLIKNNDFLPLIKCYMHHAADEDYRVFSLDSYNLSLNYNLFEEKKSVNVFTYLLYKRKKLYNKIKDKSDFDVARKMISNGLYYFNNHIDIDISEFCNKKQFSLVEGYFQSYRYFDKYRNELIEEFKLKKQLSDNSNKVLDDIKKNNSVCLHIRLGDYMKDDFSYWLKVCNNDYYYKAIEKMLEYTKSPVFYVFSNNHNDIEWIKKNFDFNKFDICIKYVDLNNSDFEDLEMMKNCKHFILSNSTYSWWAQYLCVNDEKIVIAPSKWRKYEDCVSPLIMPDFKLIDVE